MVRRLNDNFGTLGYCIIGIFVLSWIVSIAIYKWQRLDDIELGTRLAPPATQTIKTSLTLGD